MIHRAAALATALATATAKDLRWMKCDDGTQCATLHLPSGVTIAVTAHPPASTDDVIRQAQEATKKATP